MALHGFETIRAALAKCKMAAAEEYIRCANDLYRYRKMPGLTTEERDALHEGRLLAYRLNAETVQNEIVSFLDELVMSTEDDPKPQGGYDDPRCIHLVTVPAGIMVDDIMPYINAKIIKTFRAR